MSVSSSVWGRAAERRVLCAAAARVYTRRSGRRTTCGPAFMAAAVGTHRRRLANPARARRRAVPTMPRRIMSSRTLAAALLLRLGRGHRQRCACEGRVMGAPPTDLARLRRVVGTESSGCVGASHRPPRRFEIAGIPSTKIDGADVHRPQFNRRSSAAFGLRRRRRRSKPTFRGRAMGCDRNQNGDASPALAAAVPAREPGNPGWKFNAPWTTSQPAHDPSAWRNH